VSGANGFTPTEKRMLEVLRDGLPHAREELHACLDDDLSRRSSIQPHITRLRSKLEGRGEGILCVLYESKPHYQQVRFLASAYDGRS